MEIIEKKLKEIKPYENNPRKNDEAVEYVANSIKEFGFKNPIIIDKDGIIVAGHTRYKAAKKMKLKTVPCIMADDLTDEQVKAFRLADNKVAEMATWDEEKLIQEIEGISSFDMSLFAFSGDLSEDVSGIGVEEKYTNKVDTPQYEITGKAPPIDACINTQKYKELIEEIDKSSATEEVKDFCRKAAARFIVFDFSKIAEYYAAADEETQRLFELLAMVIIDYDDAVKNGLVALSEAISEMVGEDYG